MWCLPAKIDNNHIMPSEIDFNEFGIRPPEENSEDIIQKIVAIAGKTYGLATGASWMDTFDVLSQFMSPQLERSRREWEFQVYCALRELDKRQAGIIKKLYTDEEFQSLLRQAFIVAWKTHKTEKFQALKAGVINTALGTKMPFDNKEMYFRLIDELTASHLTILNFIDKYKERISAVDSYEKYYAILNGGTIDRTVPSFASSMELSTFRAIMKDLENRGLILISSELTDIAGVKRRGASLLIGNEPKEETKLPFVTITNHGLGFLSFISEDH